MGLLPRVRIAVEGPAHGLAQAIGVRLEPDVPPLQRGGGQDQGYRRQRAVLSQPSMSAAPGGWANSSSSVQCRRSSR